MHPEIHFRISVTKDIATFFAFAKNTDKRRLEWAILKSHPYFNTFLKDGNLQVSRANAEAYVRKEYAQYRDEMKRNLVAFDKSWKNIAPHYFALTDQLFGKKYWPEGKYICYPTIWGMYPRFIKDCTFQIPAHKGRNAERINIIIAHEMLHFIFYNYLAREYGEKNPGMRVWHSSEIFNAVVQSSPKWKKVFGEGSGPYPEHATITKRVSKKFYAKRTITADALITEIFREVDRSKLLKK